MANQQTPYAEKKQRLEFNPQQLAALVIIEAKSEELQLAANQLAFLEQKPLADEFLKAKALVDGAKMRFVGELAQRVKVVQAIPDLSKVNGG